MKIGIQIGASPKSIKTAHKLILAILSSGAEQETLRTALETTTKVCSVDHTTISECVFKNLETAIEAEHE